MGMWPAPEHHVPRTPRLILLILGLILFPASALACLWDSDTLRAEARGLPGIVDLLTGRFEREPDLYYQMRLARVSAAIEAAPPDAARDLSLYDDAAVACDRLGRHDDAIEWMARKRARLDAPAAADPDHEYRYLANLGTFHAHRWLATGADRQDMADLLSARDIISAAIALNPDAHFGREKYQLMAIDWLIQPAEGNGPDEPRTMGSIFDREVGYRGFYWSDLRSLDSDPDETVHALSGLIALGAAWESIDIIYSLSLALEARQDHAVAHLARLRAHELADAGRTSLDPEAPDSAGIARALHAHDGHTMNDDQIAAWYPRARKAAGNWKTHREAFMLARLNQGRHPDTDPTFWDGYRALPALAPPNGILGYAGYNLIGATAVAVLAACIVAILAALFWMYLRTRLRSSHPRRMSGSSSGYDAKVID